MFGGSQPPANSQEDEKAMNQLSVYLSRQIHPIYLSALVSGCRKLEKLHLAGCHFTESASLRQLARCTTLRHLDLSRVTNISASELALGLSGCPLLVQLFVAELEPPVEQLVPPTGLPNLVSLNVNQSGLTNNSLRRLPRLFPKLRSLSLQGCRSVKEDGLLSYLPKLRHLDALDLSGVSDVTEAVLAKLKNCHLTKLRLGSTGEGDVSPSQKGIRKLALECKSLEVLWLDVSADVLNSIAGTLKRQISSQRILVLCSGQNGAANSSVSEPQCYPHNIHVVDANSVPW
ncbi:F-box/LRR-repeat protein 20-like [Amphibalanus amphitrite]|uniref:F-box/LRR-repeat protein 20-like n=1 Tax=Amphibalanus amphitrite TaxID=1232801 RepID=UPI001C90FC7D|nr:F-box/LRR-repeat protein 20-like [Amphibalanus amphitrite]